MKPKLTSTPDCNICHKSGYVIVKNIKGKRVAKYCTCTVLKNEIPKIESKG